MTIVFQPKPPTGRVAPTRTLFPRLFWTTGKKLNKRARRRCSHSKTCQLFKGCWLPVRHPTSEFGYLDISWSPKDESGRGFCCDKIAGNSKFHPQRLLQCVVINRLKAVTHLPVVDKLAETRLWIPALMQHKMPTFHSQQSV